MTTEKTARLSTQTDKIRIILPEESVNNGIMSGIQEAPVDLYDTDAVPGLELLHDPDRIVDLATRFSKQLEARGRRTGGLIVHFEGNDLFSILFSEDPSLQGYGEWRLYRAVDIARALRTDKVVLHFTDCSEQSDKDSSAGRLCELLQCLWDYDSGLTLLVVSESSMADSGFPPGTVEMLQERFGRQRLGIIEGSPVPATAPYTEGMHFPSPPEHAPVAGRR